MKSLADVLAATSGRQPIGNQNRRRYRRNVGFVLDVYRHSSKLDRNQKVRLLVAVEIMERKTKAPGRRNGLVSLPGVLVLRALLLRFHNGGSGLCCPSISTLQDATGLCRQTIVAAIERLERIGVLIRTRRIVRVALSNGLVGVRQASNLYAFRGLPEKVPVPIFGASRPFPRVHGIGGNPQISAISEVKLLEGLGYRSAFRVK